MRTRGQTVVADWVGAARKDRVVERAFKGEVGRLGRVVAAAEAWPLGSMCTHT